MEKNQALKSVMAVVLGLLAGAVLMLVMGFDPLVAYDSLFKGGLKNITKIGDTIASATPLILTGLSVAFAFKTGLFNIGTPGQMLIGGFASLVVGLTVNLPSIILLPLMVLAGMLAGALCGAIPGLLKAKFNVHEVVSSIMMNWIILYFTQYTIQNHFKGATEDTSRALGLGNTLKAEWLTKLFGNSNALNLGIFLAIIAAFIVWFILNKTVLGYELKAVGFNRFGAEYAGMSVNRNIIVSMMIAGALAGLAGVTQYAGYADCIQTGIMPSQGFNGIAVALLGANSPLGVVLSALFFGILNVGKGAMSIKANVPTELADTIMATIIYFSATSLIMENLIKRFKNIKKNKTVVNNNERAVEK